MLPCLAAPLRAASRPAILFASPRGAAYGYADLDYLNQLHERGFDADYTRTLDELSWERIEPFHAIVVYELPEGEEGKPAAALVDRYLKAGGGVLLLPTEHNIGRHPVYELTHRYGARVPTEWITETDSGLALNNPSEKAITAALRVAMTTPGLEFQEKRVTLRPGEYLRVQ